MDESTGTTDAQKPRPTWLLPVGTGIAGLILGLAIGLGSGSGNEPTTVAQESPTPTGLTDPGMDLESPAPVVEEPIYDELTADDLELKLKTTEKSCYGSAGGLETVRISVAIDGTVADNLDPDVQWDVTYRITGDENGPIIGTFSIYPDGQYDVNEENLGTPTCETKPTITITDLEGF